MPNAPQPLPVERIALGKSSLVMVNVKGIWWLCHDDNTALFPLTLKDVNELEAAMQPRDARALEVVEKLTEALEKIQTIEQSGNLSCEEEAVDTATWCNNGYQVEPKEMAPAIIKWNNGAAEIRGITREALFSARKYINEMKAHPTAVTNEEA